MSPTGLPFRKALPQLALVTLMFGLIFGARALLVPLLPAVEQELGIGHAAAASLLFMQSAGFSTALLLCGLLISRIRPARLILFAVTGGGAALLLMPLAEGLREAAAVCLLFGLTSGFYFPAAMTTLLELVRPQDRGKAVGLHELAPPLAFLLVPPAAQFGLGFTSWKGVFGLAGGIMLAGGLLFFLRGRGGRICPPPTSFAGCCALIASPKARLAALLLIMAMVGEFSVYSVLPIYLTDTCGFNPAEANHITALTRPAALPAAFLGGLAADRYDPLRFLRICLVVHAAALFLMVPECRALNLTGIVLQNVSIALAFAPIFKLVPLLFTPAAQPVLLSLAVPAGGLVSAGVVPLFLGRCGDLDAFWFGFLCLGLLSLGCAAASTRLF